MRQQKKNNYKTNSVKQGEKQTPTLKATYAIYGLNYRMNIRDIRSLRNTLNEINI